METEYVSAVFEAMLSKQWCAPVVRMIYIEWGPLAPQEMTQPRGQKTKRLLRYKCTTTSIYADERM